MAFLLAISLGLFGAGALAVLAFEAPVRSAGGLMTAAVGAVATLGCLGTPLLPGLVLWCFVGGVGLLLLALALLLNLAEDERGRRSMRFLKGLVIPPTGLVFSAIAGILVPVLEAPTTMTPSMTLTAQQVSGAIRDDVAVALATTLAAIAAAIIGALLVARRRVS